MKLYSNDNVVLPVVGDYCLGLGIDLNTIHLCLKETTHKKFELNNGAVLELEDVNYNLLRIPVAERGSKITDFMCSKFLTSSVDSIPSFHSNYFDSIDEEKSASAKVDALLSATFELEEKVVSTKQRN